MRAQPLVSAISHRKKELLAGTFAIITWVTYPFFVQSSASVAPSAPVVIKPATVSDSRLVMPKGFQQPSVVRDPFQMPKEALPPSSAVSSTDSRAMSSPSAPQPYQVTGVAIGNGTAAAILESSAGSRSYRVGEYAGQYQIRQITLDSVLLVGSNGSHVLKMRR